MERLLTILNVANTRINRRIQLLGLPRAGGVALQGLHDRDVPGEVGIDGATGAIDVAGLDPVVPGGLRAQRRGEVAEEAGPDSSPSCFR